MLVTRTSVITGITKTLDLPITPAQMVLYNLGMHIQTAFPDLPPEQREFIKTGITSEEWNYYLKPQEDEEIYS